MKWYHWLAVWMLVLVVVGFIGYSVFPRTTVNETFGYPLRWSSWDGNNYISIATVGYEKTGLFSYAFFPFYPVIIFLLTKLFIPAFAAGWSVNLIGIFVWVYFLQELLKKEKFVKVSDVLIYILLFPTAFFFIATYTETFFMIFSIGSILFYRKNNYWISGLFGLLASATRVTGLALTVFFLAEWLLNKERKLKQLIPLLLTPIGTACYSIYLYFTKNDPLFFLHIEEEAHNRGIMWNPLKSMVSYIIRNSDPGSNVFATWFGGITFAENIICWAILFLLFAGSFMKIRKSYIIYGIVLWAMPLMTGTTSSMLRYIIVIFPAFMILAKLTEHKLILKYCIWIISTILLILATMSFHTGRWVA